MAKKVQKTKKAINVNPMPYSIEEIAQSGKTGYPYALTKTALKLAGQQEYDIQTACDITEKFALKTKGGC